MNASPIAIPVRGRKDDLFYKAVTVAAMVTLLATIWIF